MAPNCSVMNLPFMWVLVTIISVLSVTVWSQEANLHPNQGDYVGPDILTDKDKQLVAKLRPLVKDILYKDFMKTDEYLARFLRVQNYNIRKAKQAIEDTVKWRKENNMDVALLEDFSLIENEFPVVADGVDNYGRPVLIFNIGILDARKIILAGHAPKFLRILDFVLELMEVTIGEMRLETGHNNLTRGSLVLDLSGFNLRQHACVQCLPYIPRLFFTYEKYYPDLAYRVYVVNAPRTFLPIFELARPFLSEPSKKAVILFDHNSDNWKRALLNEIPADQLPTLYGGNRTVVPTTLSQLKQTNPYVKTAFDKALTESRKSA